MKELYMDFAVVWPDPRLQNAIQSTLTLLDLVDVEITARETVAIVSQFPSLKDLRLSLSELSGTLHEYRGALLNASEYRTNSQIFAADLLTSCRSLSSLSFHYHPYMSTVPHDSTVVLVRDVVASVASQLRFLEVWKTTFHNGAADFLTETQGCSRFSVLEKLISGIIISAIEVRVSHQNRCSSSLEFLFSSEASMCSGAKCTLRAGSN